jgi:hypothetical protein
MQPPQHRLGRLLAALAREGKGFGEGRSQLRVKRSTQLLPCPVQSGFHRGALAAEGIGAP